MFTDPDGDQLTFTITNPPSNRYHMSIDANTHELIINPDADYNNPGARVTIMADDRRGGTVTDEFICTITAVNDPPAEFGLQLPMQNASNQPFDDTRFVWSASSDVDAGEQVSYALHVRFQSPQVQNPETTYPVGQVLDTLPDLKALAESKGLRGEQSATFEWWVEATDGHEGVTPSEHRTFTTTPLDVTKDDPSLPDFLALHSAYPNPFNAVTHLSYDIPEPTMVSLKVYDITGKEVATLAHGNHVPNRYAVSWDANGLQGGIYFIRLQTTKGVLTSKVVLVK